MYDSICHDTITWEKQLTTELRHPGTLNFEQVTVITSHCSVCAAKGHAVGCSFKFENVVMSLDYITLSLNSAIQIAEVSHVYVYTGARSTVWKGYYSVILSCPVPEEKSAKKSPEHDINNAAMAAKWTTYLMHCESYSLGPKIRLCMILVKFVLDQWFLYLISFHVMKNYILWKYDYG